MAKLNSRVKRSCQNCKRRKQISLGDISNHNPTGRGPFQCRQFKERARVDVDIARAQAKTKTHKSG